MGQLAYRILKYKRRPTSNHTMYFGNSVESIADSDLEDGELQKMLTSPLYAQKALEKADAMVVQDREVSAQYTQADPKGKFEVSFV